MNLIPSSGRPQEIPIANICYNYNIVVYWGFKYFPDQGIDDIVHRLVQIRPYESKSIWIIKGSHRIVAFPMLEVLLSPTVTEHHLTGTFNDDRVKVIDVNLEDYTEENIVIPKVEYEPPKTDIDQWKEFGLKSNFLLKEIEKLSTYVDEDGNRVAHEKYDNIGPFIEMIQDIKEPKCTTPFDRDFAGIPSTFTNVT